MNKLLNKIQDKPYKTRVNVLWSIVAVVSVILVLLIVNSVKDTISNADGNLIQVEAAKYVPESTVSYASVEWIAQDDKSLDIYFNFNNPSDDILNVPKLSDISLTDGKNILHPQKITDRQGNPFEQKILSHTQNFGILVFPVISSTKSSLLFDQMFMENTPNDVFQQKIWLDLNQLMKKTTIRN